MLYAAYGSNLHPVRLLVRVPRAELLGTCHLPGWSLRFHKRGADGSAKCDIVAGGDDAYLAVYEISAAEKRRLDAVEGEGYDSRTLELPGYGDAYAYFATATHIDTRLKPYAWYRALVAIGCKHHAFPADYVARLAAVDTVDDPDAARHERHMALVRRALAADAR